MPCFLRKVVDMKDKLLTSLNIALALAALMVLMFNSYQIRGIGIYSANAESVQTVTTQKQISQLSAASVIPTGVPAIYGDELQISFDDVSPSNPTTTENTINRLAQLDTGISLSGSDLERYINILYKMDNGISCEYCCGAAAVIFSDGSPACSCSHSYAMRGVAKYLITQHGDEFSDEQVLEEVGKWKTLFFPTQIQAKAKILDQQGIEVNYANLASNNYRGIETGAAGGMVGGC